ncbi:regulator of G-protein signaling protein-like isoform X2 [Oryctolagus cuniculus]|uniref:regulator of G-protein signaling protein-like isoform X2 n=1 Tax=Oryctolagus cuniculus TaxID=9986 RepID=UPI00387A108F
MSHAELIGSTNLIILLEDETFADFFNTFLSLPVFGQTPFYTVENSQWSLWPDIPYDLIAKYKGLLTWLEKYRLPFFCKTNLCFHYILCQELINFIKSAEGAKMMRWKTADQWLLQKCAGGVRGMWRFCSYLKGSAGEELVDFWILAEKILSLDETDPEVEDHYLSLLLALKATHLQEGSRVLTLCNVNIKSLLNLSIWHPHQSTTRRETLGHMQKVALFKLQSYWLPNFYTHAKAALAREEACRGLLQEYEGRLGSVGCARAGGLPLNMSIRKGFPSQRRYSSRASKRKLWLQLDPSAQSLEMEPRPDAGEARPPATLGLHAPPSAEVVSEQTAARSREKDLAPARKPSAKKKAAGHLRMEGLFETKFSTHLRTATPIISHPSQALSPWYDEFLHEDDYWFLNFTTQSRLVKTRWRKRAAMSMEESTFLYKRTQEALVLSQALANLEEMDAAQWRRLAAEDLRQGGSLQLEVRAPVFLADFSKMSFQELCLKNPKAAIEKMSDDYKAYCELAPPADFPMEIIREPRKAHAPRKMSFKKAGIRKPSMRPRNLTEILLSTQHLEFFREFLRDRKAESPLQFLVAVQKLSSETNEKLYKSALDSIVKTFFHSKLPPEEVLQCSAPIVKEVAHMRHISTTTLLMLQGYIMKSLEEKWLKDYQELFPPRPQEVDPELPAAPRKPSKTTAAAATTAYFQDSQKRGWVKMISFIKSFCNYRRFMTKASKRQEFENYLHLELYNHKENFSTSPNTAGRPTFLSTNVRSADQENGEVSLVKRRIFGHRVITVNFAVNDLYFFSEMEKFNELVNSAHMLHSTRALNENDVILLRTKINIILKLYLNSDIPPKLRVNISESQKDAVLAAITEGHLDRSIFHGAIMSVFPVIMYFWKRFCSWKAVRSYLEYRGRKFKDRSPPKPTYKYPPWSGGDHAVLRFTLLRGVEWLRPQREVTPSSVQNSSSSNLTQTRLVLSSVQLSSVQGQKLPHTKKERK